MNTKLNIIFFYFFVLFLFFLDTTVFFISNYPYVHSLICLYTFQLFQPLNYSRLIIIGLLIGLQSFIILGTFGIPLLYLIPASIVVIKLKYFTYKNYILPTITLLTFLIIQTSGIEYNLYGITPVSWYTNIKIIAIIVIIWIFSLKFYIQDSTGNRL